jgi:D-sedoheptulose 7-phosphate isomerase
MSDANARLVAETLGEAARLHDCASRADPGPVLAAAAAIVESLRGGGKVLFFGNGGSASDAQHAATELVGRFLRDRVAIAALALTSDTSVLTAVANDLGYDHVFARQIEALGRRGDVAFGISTSGRSANVLRGLESARERGLRTIALTGCDGGQVGRAADIHVNVSSRTTPRVQELHITLLHVICDLIEREFADGD